MDTEIFFILNYQKNKKLFRDENGAKSWLSEGKNSPDGSGLSLRKCRKEEKGEAGGHR